MYNAPIYGVVPGGADVTEKLQALIELAISEGRRAIYFPSGEYYVTSLIDDDKVDFFGDNATFIGGYSGTIRQIGDWASTAQFADIVIENNYVSVTEKGAKLDGSDDTAALIAAISSANNGVTPIGPGGYKRIVYVPGQMTIASAEKIRIPQQMTISGNDFANARIRFTHPDGGFLIDNYVSGNPVSTYETHFSNITLDGNDTCKTLIEAYRVANFRFDNVYIGGTIDHPLKIVSGGLLWFRGCTLDGSMKSTAHVRTQRGIYLEGIGMIEHRGWNLYNLKEAFYVKGSCASLQISGANWVENVETLVVVVPNDSNQISSAGITISENYILNCSEGQSYAWNLVRYETLSTTTLSDAYLRVLTNRIFNVSGMTYKDDGVINVSNYNGTLFISATDNDFAGISKPTAVKFCNIGNALGFRVTYYDFAGNDHFDIKEAALPLEPAVIRHIETGHYNRPIAGAGIKIWNDFDNGIEGVIRYDNKRLLMYVGDDAGTDFRYIVPMRNGTAAPTMNAEAIGQMFVDTTNKKIYVATGVGSGASDWTILN